MDERGIIIADRDASFRSQVADHFRKAGYRVETTDSAVHVLCSILEKQTPVLLLGSDFDKKVSSADLIRLLKKCNRDLHVIMVSDGMALAQARQLRREGIFYEAMKLALAGDNEELGLAVECAFKKHNSGRRHPGRLHATLRQPVSRRDDSEETEPFPSQKSCLSWLVALAALVLGASFLALVAAQSGGSMAIRLFMGFCALLIATQLLPIFRIKPPARAGNQEPAKQQGAPMDKKSL